jgi:HlyD family secretion protein
MRLLCASARVSADGFKGARFSGRVVRVGQVLGKKTIRTDEPTERVDTKILEVVLQGGNGGASKVTERRDHLLRRVPSARRWI